MSLSSPAAKTFFSAQAFAVVGASADPSKFGNRVLKWYQQHSLNVIPINPKATEIEGLQVVKSLEDLPSPASQYSVSVITPPSITSSVIKSAKQLGINALWLQPGSEDSSVSSVIKAENMEDKVIMNGPCILVQGEGLMASAKL